TRDAPQIPVALRWRAEAPVEGWTATPARVRGGDQLEARREMPGPASARDGDASVLERLTQGFQHVLGKLRKLVQEQHAEMRERHLPGMGRAAPSDEPRRRHRVMRRTEGPRRHQVSV